MEAEFEPPSKIAAWTYAEIVVSDGQRTFKPTHVCSTEIIFRDPPELRSAQISVCVINGDRQTTRLARILPHEPGSTRIPIELIQTEQTTPAKLIA